MTALVAENREQHGTQAVATLRTEDVLPAVLYGPQTKETQSIQVSTRAFEKLVREVGESTLIDLQLGKETYRVLVHKIQRHPLTGNLLHVDFFAPSLTEKVEASVPVVLQGEAPAVKDLGGTLIQSLSEIEVRALAVDLPHEITADVSGLKEFSDHVRVKDLRVEGDVECMRDAEESVAHVTEPTKVEEELEKPIEEDVEGVEKIEAERAEKPEADDATDSSDDNADEEK